MDVKIGLPTRGQLERQLSQTLQSLYRQQFGHLPRKITCHLFADRVAIVAEDTVTSVEKILFNNSKLDLARSIRSAIAETFASQVRQVTWQILQVEVVDIIVDSTLDSGYLGAIVFLDSSPKLRLANRKSYKNKINKISIEEE